MRISFRKTVAMTLVAWLIGTAAYAFFYVHSQLSLQGLEGYEKDWDWQLLFFGIFRLPLLLIGLAAVIWCEWLCFSDDRGEESSSSGTGEMKGSADKHTRREQ
jgi:hypothetical protein